MKMESVSLGLVLAPKTLRHLETPGRTGMLTMGSSLLLGDKPPTYLLILPVGCSVDPLLLHLVLSSLSLVWTFTSISNSTLLVFDFALETPQNGGFK